MKLNYLALKVFTAALCLQVVASNPVEASIQTRTSPTSKGALPAAVTEVGGIVIDLVGTNGTRVVTQLPASSLYVGFSGPGNNPLAIGTQTGFTPAVVGALGGGLAEASVRITLFDGDTGPGNFDENQNTLQLNGINFGNFSDVVTQETSSTGLTVFSNNAAGGFRDNILDTGFFYSTNAGVLASLFTSISGGSMTIQFALDDIDPDDNFYDFTQGVDGGLVDVGTPPIVSPGVVPEPATLFTWCGLSLAAGAYFFKSSRTVKKGQVKA